MRPAGLSYRSGKGWMIVHVCDSCGHTNRTKAALEDRRQPDDALAIAQLSGGSWLGNCENLVRATVSPLFGLAGARSLSPGQTQWAQ